MSLFVPLEIVTEIVHHVLDDHVTPSNNHENEHPPSEIRSEKPPWRLVEPLIQLSHSYRLIALKLWFQYLYLKSAQDLKDVDEMFPELKKNWAKHLHCVQMHDSKDLQWDLSGFTLLTSVRIDWHHRQFSLIAESAPGQKFIPFVNVDAPVNHLDIRGLRYPSPVVLDALTSSFHNLVSLKLQCLRIWCGLCHTCALVQLSGTTPVELMYDDGFGLPVHYARVLSGLAALEDVHISLPDVNAAYTMSEFFGAHTKQDAWAGECTRCMSIMYQDDEFKRSWTDRKRGIRPDDVPERGVYTKPPSLRKVHWNIWEYDPEDPKMAYVKEELETDDEWLFASDFGDSEAMDMDEM